MRSERLTGPSGPGVVDWVAVTAEAAGFALKMAVLLEFQWAERPGLSLVGIVLPAALVRNDTAHDPCQRRRAYSSGIASAPA
jgi:hypothetical protein